MDTRSLWVKTAPIPPRAALENDLSADAAVLGAGMAGVLIADRLKARGARVVVLEAARVGSGQTQNTTAKITSQHGVIYGALIKRFGEERARMYALANQIAVREYADIVRARGIDCDFERAPACVYTRENSHALKAEAESARSLGIDALFTTQTELPFQVTGAVQFNDQARFHPLKFLRALSEGLEIYEHTPAVSVRKNEVITERGIVRAKHIIFAAHYPFINLPGMYFMRLSQSRAYALALESEWLPHGMYYGADAGGLSFRAAGGLLIVSGENHPSGYNEAGGRYQALLERARDALPDCALVARWSAQDAHTLDGVPYIGRFAASAPDWYVATGFGKWGMSTSMVAALAISGQIAGEAPEWANVFSPGRLTFSASARRFAALAVNSAKGLARELFAPPKAALDALPTGHGGIVEAGGRKTGVYKDAEGVCHIVSARCPHLGCQLTWNPDEKSWDCPCHGSRFGIDGKLINNPAQEDLAYESARE